MRKIKKFHIATPVAFLIMAGVLGGCNTQAPGETELSPYSEEITVESVDTDKLEQTDITEYVIPEAKLMDMVTIRITGDDDGLFGYENGILVRGKMYDEALLDEKKTDRAYKYGNFNMEGREAEREVSIVFEDKDGNELLTQNCGIRVMGGASRKYWQKSLKLYARKEYGEKTFEYPFFEDLIGEDGKPVAKFKHLVIRNSGNDNTYGFIRNELSARLAYESGFAEAVHSVPAKLYINEQYMGVFWLENFVDKRYFEEVYGEPEQEGEIYIYKGNWESQNFDTEPDKTFNEEVKTLIEILTEYESKDFTDDKVFEEFCTKVDVDNFLEFAAIEFYTENIDWDNRNIKCYRYVTDGEYYPGTIYDGRYRFILYDLDETLSYGVGKSAIEATDGGDIENSSKKNSKRFFEFFSKDPNRLFYMLMARGDCARQFKENLKTLSKTGFEPGHASEVLDAMNESRWKELSYMLNETDVFPEPNPPATSWPEPSTEVTSEEIEVIRSFLQNRMEFIEKNINDYLPTKDIQ